MVGNDPHGPVRLLGLAVPRAGASCDRSQQGSKEITVVVTIDALRDGRQPLQAHAGIDARLRQRMKFAGGIAVELHEHQVPDLDDSVAFAVRSIITRHPRTLVEMNFGTGPAWSRVRHLPEVVLFTAPDDP